VKRKRRCVTGKVGQSDAAQKLQELIRRGTPKVRRRPALHPDHAGPGRCARADEDHGGRGAGQEARLRCAAIDVPC